jgi:hypothetical protein
MINHLRKVHMEISEKEIKEIWKNGVFIFDSNVLLDIYRLPSEAKDDLLSVLQNPNFKSRIWIGFQVALEFLNNRLNIIGEQKNMYSKVISLTNDHISKIRELNDFYLKEINKLNLTQRHSKINPAEYLTSETLNKSVKTFKKFEKYLKNSEVEQLDVNSVDSIKDVILTIFDQKVGIGFNKEEIDLINKEGDERYKLSIPPGYMDVKKEGQHLFKDQQFVRKYGDLYLWKEIIKFSKEEKHKYVILVTGDVKEDWWEEKRGRKLGPRKELLNEIYHSCEDLERFHIYNTSSFLKFAKQELDSKIRETSIKETQKLIDENLNRNRNYTNYNHLQSEINHLDAKISEILIKLDSHSEKVDTVTRQRAKLYDRNEKENDLSDYARNLRYIETELKDEKNDLLNKLEGLEKMKGLLLDRYELYDIEFLKK